MVLVARRARLSLVLCTRRYCSLCRAPLSSDAHGSSLSHLMPFHPPALRTPDDGKPKPIGGVMVEWGKYAPGTASSRKAAEAFRASPSAHLGVLRAVARGDRRHAGEPSLHLVHSLVLHRRMRAVEGLLMARDQQQQQQAVAGASAGPVVAVETDGASRSGSGAAGAVRPTGSGDGKASLGKLILEEVRSKAGWPWSDSNTQLRKRECTAVGSYGRH